MEDLAEFRRQQHEKHQREKAASSNETSPITSPTLIPNVPPPVPPQPLQPIEINANVPPPVPLQPNFLNMMTSKKPAASKPFQGGGYRLGGGDDDDEGEEEEENFQTPQQPIDTNMNDDGEEEENIQPQQNINNGGDDDSDNDSDGDGNGEDEMNEDQPPPMFAPGGMPMFPPGMMNPFQPIQPFQPFEGTGHQLNELNPSLATSKPKEKGEITDMIDQRYASTTNDLPVRVPKVYERDIKKLSDICLIYITKNITPFQSKLKMLQPEVIHRMIELMASKGTPIERKKMDQIMMSGSRVIDLQLDNQDLLVNNNFLLNCVPGFVYLKSLSFSGCPNITDSGMEGFKTLINLTSLNLSGTRISDISIKFIRKLILLKDLSIRNTKITEKGIILLSPLIELEALDVSNLEMTDDALMTIATFSKLNTLLLSDSPFITQKGIQYITKLPLSTLAIPRCQKIDNSCFFFMTQFGNTIESLDIGGTNIQGAGFVNLKRMKNLRSIVLPGRNCINDSTIKYLDALENITKLDLADYIQITSISSIPSLKHLIDLSLSNTKITDESLLTISKYLNLEYLNLDRTMVSDIGVSKLAVLGLSNLSLMFTQIVGDCLVDLTTITTLKSLNIAFNNIEDNKIPPLFKLPELSFIDLRGTLAFRSSKEFSPDVTVRPPVIQQVISPQHNNHQDDEELEDQGEVW